MANTYEFIIHHYQYKHMHTSVNTDREINKGTYTRPYCSFADSETQVTGCSIHYYILALHSRNYTNYPPCRRCLA